MKKISVNLPLNGYDVYCGDNIFSQLFKISNTLNLNQNLFFVIDKNVYELYSNLIDTTINSHPGKINSLIVEASEELKSFKTMEMIYNSLIENNYTRDTLLIAIGGGIIGDICGFAAATFSRGIQYIQVPTTLLSAVDSSVGGKTGINFGNTKNIIGAFNQPNFVLIDINFIETLNKEEMLSGIGEIIKYAYLTNPIFYGYVKENIEQIFGKEKEVIIKIITESVTFKGDVVINDEKENGIRKILNLGHTFAHAYEVEAKYSLKHGQAVIVGIASSLYLSYKLGLITKSKMDDLLQLIYPFKNDIAIDSFSSNNLISIMQRDKKNKDGKIKFVLLKDVGNILIDVEASNDDITFAIENGTKIFE